MVEKVRVSDWTGTLGTILEKPLDIPLHPLYCEVMSFNRENVIWQSKGKTWNIGFFRTAWVGEDDPEWDVEYDFESFDWASTSHPTEEAAWRSWPGANPGGYSCLTYGDDTKALCDKYDQMAQTWKLEQAKYLAINRQFGGML